MCDSKAIVLKISRLLIHPFFKKSKHFNYEFKSIEAFLELAKSPNTKIIVSDGDLPMMMNQEMELNTGLTPKNPAVYPAGND